MENKKLIYKVSLALMCVGIFFIFGCEGQLTENKMAVIVTNASAAKNEETQIKFVEISENSQTSAAAQNLALKQNLDWTFGRKAQKGWYLYRPLICRLIGIENKAKENEFAKSLANWQKSVGISPNGILDETTLMKIIASWQSNRLKKRGEASADELQIVSTADFYDVSRSEELRKVEHATYAAYKKMVAAAIADKSLNLKSDGKSELAPNERFLKIISSFRSPNYQTQLRQQSPNSGRAGLAVNSPHFTGRALDIYVGGEPVSTQDANRLIQINTPVYQWLVKNADKFGFKPYFYEPWHWEYAPDSDNK